MQRHRCHSPWIVAPLLGLLLLMTFAPPVGARDAVDEIVFSGMPVPETYPMLAMIEQASLRDVTAAVRFVPWNNPDQMRALVTAAQTDFVVLPTNVAAKLNSKGVNVKLLYVSLSSSLWMLSTVGPDLVFEDLRGREIALPFRGDMPEVLFRLVAGGLGLNPDEAFRYRYVATPMDAVQLLLLGRVEYAFLAEPAISAALHRIRTRSGEGQPAVVYRAVDMQAQWQRAYPRGPGLMLGGIAATSRITGRGEVVARFMEEYRKALRWCREHPEETGALVKRHFPFLSVEAVVSGMEIMRHRIAPASEVRDQLQRFLEMTVVDAGKNGTAGVPIEDLCWQEK